MIHRSPLPSVAVPEVGVTEFVFRHAAGHSERQAFVDGTTGRSCTYRALQDSIARAAGGFAERGVGDGHVVALVVPTMPEFAVAFHGVCSAGGIVTTVNTSYGVGEMHAQLEDSGAGVVVTVPSLLVTVREAAAGTRVRRTIVIGEPGEPGESGESSGEDVEPFAALLDAPAFAPRPIDPDAVAVLPYSSGTTGLPKGVMLSHRNLVANLAQLEHHLVTDAHDEVVIACLPFFHIYGLQVVMNDGLQRGTTLVTMPRFDFGQFLQLIQQHRATRLFVVPPIVLALAKLPQVDQFDLSSVKSMFCGAAPLGADLEAELHARLGIEVVQGYGMTELSPVSHATLYGRGRAGSVGILVADAEARVVDPATGVDCDPGEDGEIWVRGPMVMRGYLNDTEATAATVDADRWLHTGDIGHVDRDGYWYVVDRLKDLIKVKGFQVAPTELEAALRTHPAVADVAVVGVPDADAGERPRAYVVVMPGHEVSEAELMAHVAARLASFKHLGSLEFVDAIPKAPSGKVLRRVLRDR
jgi:acyl-CoA synthetase (AMP-forming)/AMP-acid ligase II